MAEDTPNTTEASEDFHEGDKVAANGRQGTVTWDGRPEYQYIKVKWADDGTYSEVIPVSQVRLVAKNSHPFLTLNATNINIDSVSIPLPDSANAIRGTCTVLVLMAVAASCTLITRHLQVGMRLTRGLYTPHSLSAMFMGVLWAVPFFSILGLLGFFMPELAAVWQFSEALLTVATFQKMPNLLVQLTGGRVQLQRQLRSSGQGEAGSKTPSVVYVDGLHRRVAIVCTILPILSFCELFFNLESTLNPLLSESQFATALHGILMCLRLMGVLCIVIGMAALCVLHRLLESLNPKTAKDVNLAAKLTYCLSFVGGLRLLPRLWDICLLCNSGLFQAAGQRSVIAHSVIVCASSILCTVMGWWAFPANERHYQVCSLPGRKDSAASATPVETLKPALTQIRFCPFCGSGELKLETDKLFTESAACPNCGARNIPLSLVVRQGGFDTSEANSAMTGSSSGGATTLQSETPEN